MKFMYDISNIQSKLVLSGTLNQQETSRWYTVTTKTSNLSGGHHRPDLLNTAN